VWHFS